jgi:hypothetical protein
MTEEMNTEALHIVLQQSFSPDAALRDPAERTIANLKNVKGSSVMLLQVAAEKQVQYEVRQAAAIQLKNLCRECWVERVSIMGYLQQVPAMPPILLAPDDKELVKKNLVQALLDEPEKSIRDLLAETLHHVCIHEFPDSWPALIPQLLETIQQKGLPLRVHNALLALRKVCKRYEYKAREQRGPLNEIVAQSFPLLLPLAQELVHDSHIEAAMMLKQILKIFWSSTQFYLPGGGDPTQPSPALVHPESMQPWFDVINISLSKPLPEGQPTTLDERNAWPFWKVKKWAVQIMSRLFSRYGIPTYAEDESKVFSQYFSQNVATMFLKSVCETLNMRPSGQFCTDRVVHLCLTYIDLAVELAPTYKLLKPHLNFLLYEVCFPTLCLTPTDVELFQNDPHEFVHLQNSPLADFYDPRMSAITLVTDLVQHRGMDVTQPLLGYLTEILHRYAAAPPEQKNHIEKDGALLTFGSLSKFLLKKKKYAQELEGLMVSSVFGDFTSPVGFLRFRACWMAQQFSEIKWSDDGSHLRSLVMMVLQRLSDPALPVQIEASKALRFLIENDGAEETVLPVLPQLLTEYFRIMNEIGNDEVVAALQVIIDKFGDHIEPHAVALVTQLSQTFANYCTADEDDDDAAMAAAQCLECIATVLKGICDKPELFKPLEPMLIPLVLKILGNDGDFIEYLECALDILTFLVFFPNEITPELWNALPLIYVAFDQWAYDYLNLMVPPLQSFIGKAPQVFLTGVAQLPEGNVRYIDLVFSMVSKTVTNDRASESECRQALSLLTSILHNCPAQVDSYFKAMNDIVLAKLGQQVKEDSPWTRFAIYQVLGSALYYNPQLELSEMEARGVTEQVFQQWMKDAESMEKWLARKMTVFGLTAILSLPTAVLPKSLSSSVPNLITAAVKMAERMRDDAEKRPEEVDEGFVDEEYEEDEDDGGFAEDQDVRNEVDEAYKKALSGVANWEDEAIANFLIGDFDDDGEDFDEDFTSPLDHVDESMFLSDTIKAAYAREPDFYQQVQVALPPDTVASCQKLFAHVDSVRLQASS